MIGGFHISHDMTSKVLRRPPPWCQVGFVGSAVHPQLLGLSCLKDGLNLYPLELNFHHN